MSIESATGEIVRALRDAPSYNGMAGTTTTVEDIAADRLEQQEAEIARLRQLLSGRARFVECERLERELAAAKADLRHNDNCDICVGSLKALDGCDCECLDCSLDCRCKDCRDENKWEWRGPQEARKGE